MEVLGALALDEEGVGSFPQDGLDGEDVRSAHVPERGDESLLAPQLLVPQSRERAQLRADVDLVDGRVQAHPWVAPREGASPLRERLGPLGVLKVPQPVRHAEVAQVRYRLDAQPPHLREHLVREAPVVGAGAEVHPVVRRPVAQVTDAKFADEPEILPPALVVEALLELVNAPVPAVPSGDRGVAALDARGEDEPPIVQGGDMFHVHRHIR